MLSDNPIDLTIDPKDLLLQVVIDEWLPSEDKSILSLFQQFNRYPPSPSHYILPSNLQLALHPDAIQAFNHTSLLRVVPPALPTVFKTYQDVIKNSGYPILSVTLQPYYGDSIRLPIWIFEYWVEIGHVVDTQKQ